MNTPAQAIAINDAASGGYFSRLLALFPTDFLTYEVAARFEESRVEIAKAQKSLGFFQAQFESVGESLERAQKAYETASKHLKTYTKRVSAISGEEVPEQLELSHPPLLSKGEASGK